MELARCRRKGTPLSVPMIDLDRFKAINDTLGHAVGDETLRRFAALVFSQLREYDFFARLGGDELAVLLPDTAEKLAIAERLRMLTESARLPKPDFRPPIMTSIGVAELQSEEDSSDQLIHRADLALYAAKGSGRNRVIAASRLDETTAILSPMPQGRCAEKATTGMA
jgi:diguanylate cyclase (GGDEF)-like protein